MAAISSNHARSNSLPSTSDQQSVCNQFYRFQASQETTTSCSTSSFVGNKLDCLNDMYESVQPFLSLPSTQQSLAKGCYREQLNNFLDELIWLLDLCSTTKDALSISIDSAKQLQSVIRRKRGINNHGLTSAVEGYLSHRRKMKKAVCKTLSNLHKQNASSVKEDNRTQSNINVLKEMRLNSLAVFESLLTFILGSNTQSKPKAWSFVSKMIRGGGSSQIHQTPEEIEVKKVDQQLHALITDKKTTADSLVVDNIQKGLAEMESSYIGLSEGVECLCRHLIKTRVSILNILNC